MLVRDCMTANPSVCATTDPVVAVAKHMKAQGIGCMPVIDRTGPAGIITDRDITLRCVAGDLDPRDTPVGRIMSTEPLCVRPDVEAAECLEMMRNKGVRRLLVIDDHGATSGIVSLSDLANGDLGHEQVGRTLHDICKG